MKQKLIKWHLDWKNLIELIIKDEKNCNEISSESIISSKECDLGSWLLYSANKQVGQNQSLEHIKECHENFHQELESIIKDCQNSHYEKVKEKFPEFEKLSQNLVDLINAMEI